MGLRESSKKEMGTALFVICDDFTPIIVDIDNAGDIDFSNEAVKGFFEYLIETTLQSK